MDPQHNNAEPSQAEDQMERLAKQKIACLSPENQQHLRNNGKDFEQFLELLVKLCYEARLASIEDIHFEMTMQTLDISNAPEGGETQLWLPAVVISAFHRPPTFMFDGSRDLSSELDKLLDVDRTVTDRKEYLIIFKRYAPELDQVGEIRRVRHEWEVTYTRLRQPGALDLEKCLKPLKYCLDLGWLQKPGHEGPVNPRLERLCNAIRRYRVVEGGVVEWY